MKEKERFELFGEHCIKDNNPDARCQLLNAYVACVILNEQDKRIKELEQENQQLKQQLHDLPKKIVEEIKLQLFNHFKVKNIEEYGKLPLIDSLFTTDTVIEILDTILEKFGEKYEINND